MCCDGGFCNDGSNCCGAPHGGAPQVECCPAGTVCCPDGGCCPAGSNSKQCCNRGDATVGLLPEPTFNGNM